MLLTLMWMGVATGMFVLIAAAMKVQDTALCKGYEVDIIGSKQGQLFTSKDQIIRLIKIATNSDIKGKLKNDFRLSRIEDLLEQSSWVYNAEIYFDNKDMLIVKVTEREPIARMFTPDGQSFYIDAAGKQIPLSDKISLDVPVFTGYPAKVIMNNADSVLLQNIIATASYISSDSFWTAQVAEIHIYPCGANCWNMEMLPVVGSHRVNLGDGSDIATKFHRLYLFYDQVLKRTGFDKYKTIDVEYAGQVIGIKGNYTKIDSLQLRKNIQELLQQARDANNIIEAGYRTPNLTPWHADSLALRDSITIDSTMTKPLKDTTVKKSSDNKKVNHKDSLQKHIVNTANKQIRKKPATKEAEKKVEKKKDTVSKKRNLLADKKDANKKIVTKNKVTHPKVEKKKLSRNN